MTFERYNTVTQDKKDALEEDSILDKDDLSIHERLSVRSAESRI